MHLATPQNSQWALTPQMLAVTVQLTCWTQRPNQQNHPQGTHRINATICVAHAAHRLGCLCMEGSCNWILAIFLSAPLPASRAVQPALGTCSSARCSHQQWSIRTSVKPMRNVLKQGQVMLQAMLVSRVFLTRVSLSMHAPCTGIKSRTLPWARGPECMVGELKQATQCGTRPTPSAQFWELIQRRLLESPGWHAAKADVGMMLQFCVMHKM